MTGRSTGICATLDAILHPIDSASFLWHVVGSFLPFAVGTRHPSSRDSWAAISGHTVSSKYHDLCLKGYIGNLAAIRSASARNQASLADYLQLSWLITAEY